MILARLWQILPPCPASPSYSLLLALLAPACGKEIGDDCATNVDCPQDGTRDCDLSQPGGYCTVNGCDEKSCPSEAVCIRIFPYEFRARHASRIRIVRQWGLAGCACQSDSLCGCTQDSDCTSDGLCLPDGICVPRTSERRYCERSAAATVTAAAATFAAKPASRANPELEHLRQHRPGGQRQLEYRREVLRPIRRSENRLRRSCALLATEAEQQVGGGLIRGWKRVLLELVRRHPAHLGHAQRLRLLAFLDRRLVQVQIHRVSVVVVNPVRHPSLDVNLGAQPFAQAPG